VHIRRKFILEIDPLKSIIIYACVKLPMFRQKSKQLGGLESGPGPNGAKHKQPEASRF
jgi:hypothetical protein